MNRLVNTIALVVMIYSIAVSTTHIVETSLMIGLVGWQAFTSPLLVDAVFLLGKLGRSKRYEDRPGVRKGALALMVFGGGLSLTCNLAAGANWGQRIHGVVVVVVMVWVESFAAKLVESGRAVVAMVTQAQADTAVADAIAIVTAKMAAMEQQLRTEAADLVAEAERVTRDAMAAQFETERAAIMAAVTVATPSRPRVAAATRQRRTVTANVTGAAINPRTGQPYSERHGRRLRNGK